MKEVNKGILDNDMVISAENIQKMGEVIALTCIKTVIVRSGKDLHYLYQWLLRVMNRSKDDYSPFSNAYDIAQEAMLFLCQHIGRNSATTILLNTERSLQLKVLVIVVPTIICKSNTHARKFHHVGKHNDFDDVERSVHNIIITVSSLIRQYFISVIVKCFYIFGYNFSDYGYAFFF